MKYIVSFLLLAIGFASAFATVGAYMVNNLPLMPTVMLLLFITMFIWFMIDEILTVHQILNK